MIGQKAAIGSLMMVGARLMTRGIDLVALVVFARVLGPADFGIVAVAGGIVAILESALELPVNQALVRLSSITRAQYDTAFTLSLIRGAVLTAVLVATAWPLARFYGDGRLTVLICVLSLSPASRGLVSPRLAEYQKELSFWRDFSLELCGKLVAFAIGISVALATSSYWAIAAGGVAFPLAVTVGSYVLAPYRPRLTLSQVSLFSGFLGWLSAAQIINAVNWQLERLLLGKLMPPSKVGLFTTSSDIASTPFLAFFGPVLRPLLAAFSRLGHDPARLGTSYLTASSGVVALGLPVLVGECLVADPAVRLMLGEKWVAAVPLVQWLALSMIPALLALPAVPLIMSAGNTRLVAYRNMLELGVKLPVCIIGVIGYGFAGAILARFLSEVATGVFCMMMVSRLAAVPVSRQLSALLRSVLSAAAMVPAVLLMSHLAAWRGLAPATMLACAAGTGIIVYIACLYGLWRAQGRPEGLEVMALRLGTPFGIRLREGAMQHLPRSRRAAPLPEEGGHV